MNRAVPVLVILVMLAACGGTAAPDASSEPTIGTTGSTSSVPPTTTTTLPEPMVIVALGDSTPAGFGVGSENAYPVLYGTLVAAETGREVDVRNHATGNTRTVAEWAVLVREDPEIRADIEAASVVMVWMGWHDILPIVYLKTAVSWPDPMREALIAKNAEMAAAWEDLLTVIRELAPGASVLVADTGFISSLEEVFGSEPFWEEFERLTYLDWRDAMSTSAAAHGAVVVPTAAAIGGPGEHPEFGSEDGLHLSPEGQAFLAELHTKYDGIGADGSD